MPFLINQFKARGIPLGGARPALFEVMMGVPSFVVGDAEKIRFQCMAAQIPPATVGVIDVPYFGRKIKLPGDRVFPDWTINIINDEDFPVRSIMEQWSNGINTMETNLRLGDPIEEYKINTDALVSQFSKDGSMLRRYKLISCWPNNVEAINLDWDRTNAIETFAVTLSYDYWILDTSTNISESIAGLPQGSVNE